MNFNDFTNTIDSLNNGDDNVALKRLIRELSDLETKIEKLSSQDYVELNNVLKGFDGLYSVLSGQPEINQGITMEKLTLFAECDSRLENFDSHVQKFKPDFTKLEIVHCDFTGVGFEWNGPHYAIVWEVDPKFDSVMVIPLTSKKRKHLPGIFSVGQVAGLPKGETTVLVSDMTRVSRKRLSKIMYKHPRNGVKAAKLPNPWLTRIQEAIVVIYSGEKTFEEYIINNCGVAMPKDLKVLNTLRYKPIKGSFDSHTLKFNYRLWNDNQEQCIELLNPNEKIDKFTKKNLIKDLFSEDQLIRETAEKEFSRLYDI